MNTSTINVARTALKGVTFHNPLKAFKGYTLFCPYGYSPFTNAATDIWLIDMEGYIVHRWPMPYLPSLHATLLPNGNLLYPAATKTTEERDVLPDFAVFTYGDACLEYDWEGNLVWQVETPYQHHDVLLLPNHHIIYPTHGEPKGAIPDEIAAKWKGGLPGTEVNGKMYSDIVYELDENGKTVWEWNTYEHLDPEIDAICPLEKRQEWHINSFWLCKDGSILISVRNLSEILRVEYPSGKVIARYGRDKISHQHDARELDNGNITCFDNGAHRYGYELSYSRVAEIDPNTDEIVWEYRAECPSDFYSAVTSGAERLPNGNTIICDSVPGRIFEVTYEGELVWEYISPFMGFRKDVGTYGGKTFRAHRYPADYPGLKGKDLDPAKFPWENRLFGPEALKNDFKPCIF